MQLALAYDAAHVGAADWDAELSWFRRAVEVIGHKEVAYKLDVQPSNLSDAINERERKDVKGKWISTVRRMCSPAQIDEYIKLLCAQHDYEAPARRKAMTPEQELRAMRALLKVHAPAVLEVVNKELGR